MTDNPHSSPLPIPLMYAAVKAEFELAHRRWPPWITDLDPQAMGTYLTSCVNDDGAAYVATHYWHNGWGSAGPFVRVTKWMELPPA